MGRMVGDSETEAELLNLLWKLMHEREVLATAPTADPERRNSALDQCDLQIVRTLALLALVRTGPEGAIQPGGSPCQSPHLRTRGRSSSPTKPD